MWDITCVTDRPADGMTTHQISIPHLSTVTFISDAACFMDGKHEQEVQGGRFTRFFRGSAWDAAFSYQSKIDASMERGSHVDYLQISTGHQTQHLLKYKD